MSQDVVTTSENDASKAREILVLDASESVRRGLDRLFREAGLAVTGVADMDRAQDQLTNRFFAVALVDLDTPTPDAGLALISFVKEHSPLTSIIVMTGRQSFEVAARAFRAGAHDVVPKAKEAVPYMRQRVIAAAAAIESLAGRDRLLSEISEIHEQFLSEMMEMSRRVLDLEDRILAGDRDPTPVAEELAGPLNLLVVDDDGGLPSVLERGLAGRESWRLRIAQSGGEALDCAGQITPHVVVVKVALPDLPSTMVIKTIKASAPDMVALLFTPPRAGESGEVRLMEGSRLLTVIPSFQDPAQLLTALEEVRQALRQKVKERRYMNAFRKEHFDFLRRYNHIKQELARKDAKERTKAGGQPA